MHLNVFINMTNMFSHQKIVYRDLGTAKKIFKYHRYYQKMFHC